MVRNWCIQPPMRGTAMGLEDRKEGSFVSVLRTLRVLIHTPRSPVYIYSIFPSSCPIIAFFFYSPDYIDLRRGQEMVDLERVRGATRAVVRSSTSLCFSPVRIVSVSFLLLRRSVLSRVHIPLSRSRSCFPIVFTNPPT